MFTRFNDDPLRIMKKLQESTDQGMYQLNTPGPGDFLPYYAEPHLRLQQWGGNRAVNAVQVESELRNIGVKLSRDCVKTEVAHTPVSYPVTTEEITAQPRSLEPAFALRDQRTKREFQYLPLNPQANIFLKFETNADCRYLGKLG